MSLEPVLRDLRLALRGLVREPGHALVAVAILAIGIGANTAVFSVVNPLLLKSLPFRDADRLVWIANVGRGDGLSSRTYRVAAYEAMARENRSFESMSAYFAFFGYISFTLTGSGEPERLAGVHIAGPSRAARRPAAAGAWLHGRRVEGERPGRGAAHRRALAPPIRRRPFDRRQDRLDQ